MTMPTERTRAVMQTKAFLLELQNTTKSPGFPENVRQEAHRLLRHYPDAGHLDSVHHGAPDLWGPVPDGMKTL
jgi:hypothetical protein